MKTRESGMPDESMWTDFFDAEAVLRKLGLTSSCGDVVDFGCGDGSLLLTAVKKFGAAKGIGYEIHPGIRWIGLLRARIAGVSDKIDLQGGNFFKVELPKADVVATYLFPETQAKLEPLLKKYYPSGTRVVSRTFRYPSLLLIKTSEAHGEKLYLYKLP